MSNSVTEQVKNTTADEEIDLINLIIDLWKAKLKIIAITCVFAIFSVFIAISLDDIYKSEATLAPATDQKAGGISAQLGGLAALAGVSIGGGAIVDKATLSLEILQSYEFLSTFIDKKVKAEDLLAVDNWNPYNKKLTYDDELFETSTGTWVRTVDPLQSQIPSSQEKYKAFIDRLNVNQDKVTGIVTLSIEHKSPYVAQQWLKDLIDSVNYEIKIRDINEAKKNMEYIEVQIAQTTSANLKTALYTLLEEQAKTLLLANVRDDYAFKIIDKPIIEEEKSKPRRAVICIAITLLGGFLAVIFFMTKYVVGKIRSE